MFKKLKFACWCIVFIFTTALIASALVLSSCTPAPPNNMDNVCSIFRQYPQWYWDLVRVRAKWGLPINVAMAIMHQESRFDATAKPPREKLLWVIPWFRPTSAYGYSQAVDSTWYNYKYQTKNTDAVRDAFADAADFMGWYAYKAHERLGISKNNTYALYLAYHEGMGGYEQGTYHNKPWLIAVARKVQARANVYYYQLKQCAASIPKPKSWWEFW